MMRSWFIGQIVLLVGALGVSGVARAQGIESGVFTSEAQAQRYLRENPAGPQAKAAFLAIVEFQLARENPGFSRDDIARSVNLPVTRSPSRPGREREDRESDRDLY